MLILKQMLILFFVMIVGFIARKKEIIDDHASKKLSGIVVNIANPAMILSGVMGETSVTRAQFFRTIGIAAGMYAVLVLLACFLPRALHIKEKEKANIYKMMLIFSNIGFMGFPIISATYGKEALLYATLFILPYNVLAYTYGIFLVKPKDNNENAGAEKEGKSKSSLSRICNIGVIACVLAIVLFLSGIRLPEIAASTIDMLGGLTSPLSMLVIGASFYQMNFKELFTDVKLLVFSAVKLLIIPVIGVFVFRQMISETMLLGVCMIMLATPVGSMNSMLAQEYGGDAELTARGVAITTLLSVVTIPVVSAICGL